MLVKLLSKQVADRWELISQGILASLPPHIQPTDIRLRNIYLALLDGRMQCWFWEEYKGQEIIPYGMLLTTVVEDFCSGEKNMSVFALYAYKDLPAVMWQDAFLTLHEVARKSGCYKILANTNSRSVIQHVKDLGGRVESIQISMEVQEHGK